AQSQSLTRELQKQQQELKQTNERLGYQAGNLQKSESLLKMQQEELRHANDELQHKAELLSDQMRQVEYKNREIELAKAALEQKLDFSVSIDPGLPVTIETDEKRLQQVLKNLLSNAFKFTARGAVQLRIAPADSGWSPGRAQLATASEVIAFIVSDTGVGI